MGSASFTSNINGGAPARPLVCSLPGSETGTDPGAGPAWRQEGTMMRTSKIGISAALCLGLLEGTSRDAHACGGFFCRQVPVDQTGEQIIFSVAPNHVTAHIQINYSGSASEFAWMVPVQAKPVITLGSRAVFQSVGGLTQPQFRLE